VNRLLARIFGVLLSLWEREIIRNINLSSSQVKGNILLTVRKEVIKEDIFLPLFSKQ
jgi:hypothetical protein